MELREAVCDLPDATKIAEGKMLNFYTRYWLACKSAISTAMSQQLYKQ